MSRWNAFLFSNGVRSLIQQEHHILYDDKIKLWHDLSGESWTILRPDGTPDTSAISIDRVTQHFINQRCDARQRQRLIRNLHLAARDLEVINFLQSSDRVYDLLTVCNE